MRVPNWVSFSFQEDRTGSLGMVVDPELRWVVFDDLFTSRKQWAAGGERSHFGEVDYPDDFFRANPRGQGG